MQIPSINTVSTPIPTITHSKPYTASLSQANTAPSTTAVDNAVTQLNNFYANDTSLTFHIDNSTDYVVINVIDSKSHRMISQMPTEQALVMARLINNQMANHTGLLVNHIA
jgi:flagellar protein FlaG